MIKCPTCEGCGRVGTNLADAVPCEACWCDICKASFGERPCRDCGWTPQECEEARKDMEQTGETGIE
jgi:hypothetical protein